MRLQYPSIFRSSAILFALAWALACGGGGANHDGKTKYYLSGTAASGYPMNGTVEVKDSAGRTVSVRTDPAGAYQLDVADLAPGYMLHAFGTANNQNVSLYSWASTPGTTNITPLTNLIVARAGGQPPEKQFIKWNGTQLDEQIVTDAKRLVQSLIQGELVLNGVALSTDLITSPFKADHTGLDGALDHLKITVSDTGATIVNTVSNASTHLDLTGDSRLLTPKTAKWGAMAGTSSLGGGKIAIDGSGNILAGGHTTLDPNLNVVTELANAAIYRIDSAGTRHSWAQPLSPNDRSWSINGIGIDNEGNVYGVGSVGSGSFDFGGGISLPATSTINSTASRAFLVKYNNQGVALWAQTISLGSYSFTNASNYLSLACGGDGSVYVVGFIEGANADFGHGVSLVLPDAPDGLPRGPLVVKYSGSGQAQWARSLTSGYLYPGSDFRSVACDPAGGVLVAGALDAELDCRTFSFGSDVSMTVQDSGIYPIVAKYDVSGAAQWVRVPALVQGNGLVSWTDSYSGICTDARANVYVVGSLETNATYDFGNGVTLASSGFAEDPLHCLHSQPLVAKFDSLGNAQWVKSTNDEGAYMDIATDGNGNVCIAGRCNPGNVDFGNGLRATLTGYDPILVCYDSTGAAQWLRTNLTNTPEASFTTICLGSTGEVYLTGNINGSGIMRYSDSVLFSGSSTSADGTTFLLKYGD